MEKQLCPILLANIFDTNLIVVSEKIITHRPTKKVAVSK